MKAGDVVSLKSARHILMTVEKVLNNNSIACVWFTPDNELHRENFNRESLVLQEITK